MYDMIISSLLLAEQTFLGILGDQKHEFNMLVCFFWIVYSLVECSLVFIFEPARSVKIVRAQQLTTVIGQHARFRVGYIF